MNNAGALKSRLIVVLNDNDMSIARPVGAMSAYLQPAAVVELVPEPARAGGEDGQAVSADAGADGAAAEEYARGMLTGGTLFEELGFYYVGPIDGHDLDHLLPVLRNLREAEEPDSGHAGPDPAACDHAEGQGLRAGGGLGRQAARGQQVQCRDRPGGQGAAGARRPIRGCSPTR
jgi:hypothetical protein